MALTVSVNCYAVLSGHKYPVQITWYPSNSVYSGTPVIGSCHAVSTNEVDIKGEVMWFKNESWIATCKAKYSHVSNNNKYSCASESRLLIHHVSHKDEGGYTCLIEGLQRSSLRFLSVNNTIVWSNGALFSAMPTARLTSLNVTITLSNTTHLKTPNDSARTVTPSSQLSVTPQSTGQNSTSGQPTSAVKKSGTITLIIALSVISTLLAVIGAPFTIFLIWKCAHCQRKVADDAPSTSSSTTTSRQRCRSQYLPSPDDASIVIRNDSFGMNALPRTSTHDSNALVQQQPSDQVVITNYNTLVESVPPSSITSSNLLQQQPPDQVAVANQSSMTVNVFEINMLSECSNVILGNDGMICIPIEDHREAASLVHETASLGQESTSSEWETASSGQETNSSEWETANSEQGTSV